jgi:hypothetical protein
VLLEHGGPHRERPYPVGAQRDRASPYLRIFILVTGVRLPVGVPYDKGLSIERPFVVLPTSCC